MIESEDNIAALAPVQSSKKKRSGFLMRMLQGGENTTSDPRTSSQALDQPPSAQHTLAMRGHGQAFAVVDLIGFLSSQHKTGILIVSAPGETFSVELEGGDIVHAQSDQTPDGQRLGDILVTKDAIGREPLEEIRKTGVGGRLGEVLLERGLVSKEQILAALQMQIQLLFNRMFAAPATGFTFWSGPPLHADERLRMNATSLLLEGARVADEANWFWQNQD